MSRAVGDTARGSCRSGVLDGCFDVVLDACRSCAASLRGTGRAHCRGCHATFDDELLFDAHRRTALCASAVPGSGMGGWWAVPTAGRRADSGVIGPRPRKRFEIAIRS